MFVCVWFVNDLDSGSIQLIGLFYKRSNSRLTRSVQLIVACRTDGVPGDCSFPAEDSGRSTRAYDHEQAQCAHRLRRDDEAYC